MSAPAHDDPPAAPREPQPAADAPARTDDVKAGHGFRNEVSWDGGAGRQPYTNRGDAESASPNFGNPAAGGDRGAHSGVHLDQLEKAKRDPAP